MSNRNELRLKSMHGLNSNIISYYSAHIRWLDELVLVIKNKDIELMPELDSTQCIFGQWLNQEGKTLIDNDEKYHQIHTLHKSLHFIAAKIKQILKQGDCNCHTGMTYLEKAEFYSLEIGTELALLDNKRIMSNAAKDPLTKVLNRSLLKKLFYDQYEIAFVTDKSFTIVMCDLDHFKEINDTYGHNQGDIVLQLFAKTLKEQLRNSDLIFRYGGDEFIIILAASSWLDAQLIFKEIGHAFRKKIQDLEKINTIVTLSAGVYEINPSTPPETNQSLFDFYMEEVDKNLYQAKANGRNCIE